MKFIWFLFTVFSGKIARRGQPTCEAKHEPSNRFAAEMAVKTLKLFRIFSGLSAPLLPLGRFASLSSRKMNAETLLFNRVVRCIERLEYTPVTANG
jgi:hypothetical protein